MVLSQTLRVIGVVCSAWLGGLGVFLSCFILFAAAVGWRVVVCVIVFVSDSGRLDVCDGPLASNSTPCSIKDPGRDRWLRQPLSLGKNCILPAATVVGTWMANEGTSLVLKRDRYVSDRLVLAAPALPNDEAQTPRWGYPNSLILS